MRHTDQDGEAPSPTYEKAVEIETTSAIEDEYHGTESSISPIQNLEWIYNISSYYVCNLSHNEPTLAHFRIWMTGWRVHYLFLN